MAELLSASNESFTLLVGVVIFVLLLVTVSRVLKEIPLFEGKASAAIAAICVSLLSLIGMFRFLGPGVRPQAVSEEPGGDGTNLDFILLPYAALGVAIVLLAIYLFVAKHLGKGGPKDSLSRAKDGTETTFRPDPGKSDKPAKRNIGKKRRGSTVIQQQPPSSMPPDRLPKKRVRQSDICRETESDRTRL